MTCNATESTVDLILAEEPRLRRMARRLARCSADVDDLVQNTMLRAYAARGQFQPGTSIRAWTSTILNRVFLTGVARDRRRNLELDTDADGPLDRAPGRRERRWSDGVKRLSDVAEDLEDELKRALERLPDLYQRPFFLHAVQDMSCEDIANSLGIPVGTVMSRIHRARERLRVALAAHRDGVRRTSPQLRALVSTKREQRSKAA